VNITCEKCHKRYSIADERVRGKSVKIRCKHCQAIMAVKGPPDGARPEALPVAKQKAAEDRPWDDEPTRAAPALDPTIVWYVMVKGKQQGPFDIRALHTKVKESEVSLRSYVWHQGMGDWKRARDVGELATLFSAHSAATSMVAAPQVAEAPPPVAPVSAAPEEQKKPRRTRTTALNDQTKSGPRAAVSAEPAVAPGPPVEAPPAAVSAPPPVTDGALSSVQTPAPELVPAPGARDQLGELFSDDAHASLDDGPFFESVPTASPGKASSRKNGKAHDEVDPFASMGEIDPAMLPPPGEATRFFIEQAGVHKRNPPWKIALFITLGIALPAGVLYGLSALAIVPLEVTRVDDQGREVKESIFSAGGVSGLGDLLTGKAKQKKEQAAAKAKLPKTVVASRRPDDPDPVREVKPPPVNAPTHEELAALYGDAQKVDKGPRVRVNSEVKTTDSSTSGLSSEAVSKVVGLANAAFQQCIEQELRKNPGFRGGKIDIITTVASSGIVKRAEIDRKEIDMSDLGSCLKGRAKRLQFPAFSGEEEAEIHIPLILSATL
jgi:predicted Zn finger-like uncharacterized protein